MAVRDIDNHQVKPGETALDLIENDRQAELDALDALPVRVRRAVDEAAIGISARSILDVLVNDGWPEHIVIREIRKADERVAIESGTMPGTFWMGRSLVLRPKGERDTASPRPGKPMRHTRTRPGVRRLSRGPGSY